MQDLKDTVVLVTGAHEGVGRGLALEAGARGAQVVIVDIANADDVVTEIESAGGRAVAFIADIADYSAVENVATEVRSKFGGLNILVNNASAGVELGGLDSADPALASQLFGVNVVGIFNGIRAFAGDLVKAAESGAVSHILNVGSEHSLGVPPHVPPLSTYTVSKYATLGFTDVARRDLGPAGVNVSMLAPGWVLTERVQEMIGSADEIRAMIEPFAQSTAEVAKAAFDGLLAGHYIIVTNPASQAFAIEHAQAVIAEVERLTESST